MTAGREPDGSAVESYLHEHIPISRAMALTVDRADRSGVTLRAPLEPNVNHRSTVFGGSIASVAILAAWTLVHLRVQAAGVLARVVIQRGSTDYARPIRGTFRASCESPGEEAWTRFLRLLERRGQARIELQARVEDDDGALVATFAGAYVAIAGAPEG